MSEIIHDDTRGTMRVGLHHETRTFSWRPKPVTKRQCEGESCTTVLGLKMRFCTVCSSIRNMEQSRKARTR